MVRLKKTGSFLLIAVLLVVQALPVLASETIQIDIISFNDFHGALIAPSDTDRNMGAAKFVTAIHEEAAKNPNTLVVAAGDNYNGSALSNLLYGKPVSDMLRAIGIVASAVGNHEFDWGVERIPVWAEDMGAPFIAANITYKETGLPVEWALPYIIEEVGGVQVAFIGLTTQETAYKANPVYVDAYNFEDPVAVTEKYVPIVKEAGADIVILLTHIGSDQDGDTIILEAGAENLPYIEGVDGIITGHYHNVVSGEINGVPVVQGSYNGRALAKIQFIVDSESKEIITATPSVDMLYERKAEIAENPEIAALMASYEAEVAPIFNEVIGYTENGLHHERRVGVTQLGQWTAEQMRIVSGADVGFQNDGGLRTTIEPGEITMGKLYEVMPFDNVITILNMSGASIQGVLEHGIENDVIGPVQMSGFSKIEYTKDGEGNIVVLEMVLADGTVVADDATYRVVTNDFMAAGGDDFTAFLEGELISETVAIRDCLVAAIASADIVDHELTDVLVYVDAPAEAYTAPYEEPYAATEEIAAEESETAEIEAEAVSGLYTVVQGDSLYRISVQFYDDGNQWHRIFEANRAVIVNPHLIYVGQELLIP